MNYKGINPDAITKSQSFQVAIELFEELSISGLGAKPREYQVFVNKCPLCQYVINIDRSKNPKLEKPQSCETHCPVKWTQISNEEIYNDEGMKGIIDLECAPCERSSYGLWRYSAYFNDGPGGRRAAAKLVVDEIKRFANYHHFPFMSAGPITLAIS